MGEREYTTLNWHKEGHCVVMDLNESPEDVEALSRCCTELSDLCERIACDEETSVVVLSFEGDMRDPAPGISSGEKEKLSLTGPVSGLKQPVIAAVRGNALDLGLELALACDIRIGTESAVFGLSQVCGGGIPANGGTQRLPRLIGQGWAMQMILTGKPVDAVEALRIGLVHRLAIPEALMTTTMEMAREMATKSPLSLSFVKEALYGSIDMTLEQGLVKEMDLYLLLFGTSDRIEGITAFMEKRKPEFKGI